MDNKTDIKITTYDRLLRAWEYSMEMTRDFEVYSKRVEEDDVKEVFRQFAEDEGRHAAKLRQIILKRQDGRTQ